MDLRCKLVAKKDLYGKIKKGDVITFITQARYGANPSLDEISQAVANFTGHTDPKHPQVRNMAQLANYQMTIERV